MKNVSRFRRLAVPSSVLGVGVAAVVTALAQGAPSAGGALANTDRPTLTSVTIVQGPGTPAGNPKADYCFDETIGTVPGGAGSFHLRGYDSNVTTSGINTPAIQNPGAPNCVRVEFSATTDIARFTVAEVDANAVQRPAGSGGAVTPDDLNIDESDQLDTGTSGLLRTPAFSGNTAGPDLVNAAVEPGSPNQIRYTFDHPLASAGAASSYGYYDTDGTQTIPGGVTNEQFTGSGAATIDPSNKNQVVVTFDAVTGGAPFAGAPGGPPVRFFVDGSTVTSLQGLIGGNSNPEGALGGTTTGRPDLTAVTPVAGTTNQFDLTYDEPVTGISVGDIQAYTESGDSYSGSSFTQPNPGDLRVVRITFDGLVNGSESFGHKVVKITDDGGGATALTAPNSNQLPPAPSTVGAIGIATANTNPGFTSGPDFRQVSLDASLNRATFRFDQPVDPNTVSACSFYLVRKDGGIANNGCTVVPPSAGQPKTDVVIQYSPDVFVASTTNPLVGGTVFNGGVDDPEGESNPLNTVAAGNLTTTSTTSPPPTTSSTTTSTTGTGTTTTTGGGTTGAALPGQPGGGPKLTTKVGSFKVASIVDGGSIVASSSDIASAASTLKGGVVSSRFTGAISIPNKKGFNAKQLCGGKVRIKIYTRKGGKLLSNKTGTVSRNTCKYSKRVKFPARKLTSAQRTKLGGHGKVTLYSKVRYGGDRFLKSTKYKAKKFKTRKR